MELFSDRKGKSTPQALTEITEGFWQGVTSLVNRLIDIGAFALDFPEICEESDAIIGVHWQNLNGAIKGNIPSLDWPIDSNNPQSTDVCFDLLEFLFNYVSDVEQLDYHSFLNHYHLKMWRSDESKENYRKDVNQLFKRQGLAYEMNQYGQIEPLIPEPLINVIQVVKGLNTGDSDFDRLIHEACEKITERCLNERKIAVEKLWDAWERLKTLDGLNSTF